MTLRDDWRERMDAINRRERAKSHEYMVLREPSGPGDTMTTHLRFSEQPSTRKTQIWSVHSAQHQGVTLGEIKWYSPWRRYVFYPAATTLFDVDCLNEVVAKIQALMDERQ